MTIAWIIIQILFVSIAIAVALLTVCAIFFLIQSLLQHRGPPYRAAKPGLCKCKYMFLQADEDHIIGDEDDGDEEVWHARGLCQPLRETILQDD